MEKMKQKWLIVGLFDFCHWLRLKLMWIGLNQASNHEKEFLFIIWFTGICHSCSDGKTQAKQDKALSIASNTKKIAIIISNHRWHCLRLKNSFLIKEGTWKSFSMVQPSWCLSLNNCNDCIARRKQWLDHVQNESTSQSLRSQGPRSQFNLPIKVIPAWSEVLHVNFSISDKHFNVSVGCPLSLHCKLESFNNLTKVSRISTHRLINGFSRSNEIPRLRAVSPSSSKANDCLVQKIASLVWIAKSFFRECECCHKKSKLDKCWGRWYNLSID